MYTLSNLWLVNQWCVSTLKDFGPGKSGFSGRVYVCCIYIHGVPRTLQNIGLTRRVHRIKAWKGRDTPNLFRKFGTSARVSKILARAGTFFSTVGKNNRNNLNFMVLNNLTTIETVILGIFFARYIAKYFNLQGRLREAAIFFFVPATKAYPPLELSGERNFF